VADKTETILATLGNWREGAIPFPRRQKKLSRIPVRVRKGGGPPLEKKNNERRHGGGRVLRAKIPGGGKQRQLIGEVLAIAELAPFGSDLEDDLSNSRKKPDI